MCGGLTIFQTCIKNIKVVIHFQFCTVVSRHFSILMSRWLLRLLLSLWLSINVPLEPFICHNKKTIQHSKRPPSTQTNQKIASSFSSWIRQSRRCFSAAFKVPRIHLGCTRDFISAWIVETPIKLSTKDRRNCRVLSSADVMLMVCVTGLCFGVDGGNFCNPNWDNNGRRHHVECGNTGKPFKEMLVPVL